MGNSEAAEETSLKCQCCASNTIATQKPVLLSAPESIQSRIEFIIWETAEYLCLSTSDKMHCI